MNRRVTMKDVALKAGVSQATVSHAMRGTGRMGAAKRLEIRTIAEKIGYKLDPMMSALASYRNITLPRPENPQTLALIIAEEENFNWKEAHDIIRLIKGVQEGGQEWGFNVEIFPHDGSDETCRRLSRVLYHRGIRGVILSFPRPFEKDKPRELDWEKFVVISCKPIFSRNIFHSVSTDHFANGRIIYRKLTEIGYSRIGLCFSEALDLISNRAFKAGVWTEQQLLTSPPNQIPPLLMQDWGGDVFADWFRDWQPDALITQHWRIQVWLKNLGAMIPDNIGVAVPSTSDDEYYAGINQHHHEMGRQAVRLLREHLILGNYGKPEIPLNLNVPSSWFKGQTLINKSAGTTVTS